MRTISPKLLTSLALCLALTLSAGCASDGSLKNPFASNANDATTPPATPTATTFFGEFPDIPIPSDLTESRSDSFVTFAPSGVKCGVQRFTGRVEVVSLMNTMRRYMATNGWTLRSLLRAKESVLVFDKPDRIASLQINDGLVNTEMRVIVSARLDGDSPTVDINAYGAPAANGAAPLLK